MSCDKFKCSLHFNEDHRKFLHQEYYSLGTYLSQNVYLRMLMTARTPEVVNGNPIKQKIRWNYEFSAPFVKRQDCRKFFCKVLQLMDKRVTHLQNKILNQRHLSDARGKHGNTVKLTGEVKNLIKEHCESIPHSESHYDADRKKLKAFDNPEISLIILYKEFLKFYTSKTGKSDLRICLSAYSKYFNHHLPFTFTLPRVDVCDFCFQNKSNETSDALKHQRDIVNYKKLKAYMMSETDGLRLEFDFAQNLPLPQLPVTDQIYKRLLWMFLLNVHVFGTDRS